jgi:hypothetical protein
MIGIPGLKIKKERGVEIRPTQAKKRACITSEIHGFGKLELGQQSVNYQ